MKNVNPTPTFFKAPLKTLLINNFMSSHAPSANYEEDESIGLISLKKFLHTSSNGSTFEPLLSDIDEFQFSNSPKETVLQLHAYLAGYVAKCIVKVIGICIIYHQELLAQQRTHTHSIIKCFNIVIYVTYISTFQNVINVLNPGKNVKFYRNINKYIKEIMCTTCKNMIYNFFNNENSFFKNLV